VDCSDLIKGFLLHLEAPRCVRRFCRSAQTCVVVKHVASPTGFPLGCVVRFFLSALILPEVALNGLSLPQEVMSQRVWYLLAHESLFRRSSCVPLPAVLSFVLSAFKCGPPSGFLRLTPTSRLDLSLVSYFAPGGTLFSAWSLSRSYIPLQKSFRGASPFLLSPPGLWVWPLLTGGFSPVYFAPPPLLPPQRHSIPLVQPSRLLVPPPLASEATTPSGSGRPRWCVVLLFPLLGMSACSHHRFFPRVRPSRSGWPRFA